VENSDLRTQSSRHLRSVDSNYSTAQNHDLGRGYPGNTAEENATSAVELLQVFGAFLHRHSARDLGHRDEERKIAIRQLHGLVRDACGAAIDVREGQLLVG